MENRSDSRNNILMKASWVSTVGNFILSTAKIAAGFLSGSLAVLSDGIDSATDVLISIVMLFTAGIIRRKPSPKYVYSYQKAEGVATMVLSLVIFYAGIQMLFASLGRIFSGEPPVMPTPVAIWVTAFSIAGKLLLAFYQQKQGRRAESSLLIANAKNMRSDVLISAGVLVGLFFTFILRLPILDAVTSLLISLFIIRTSVQIFIDSNTELMDGVKDIKVYDKIFESVGKVEGASNPHRVRSRQIGNLYMISLDIEADGDMSLNEAHEIAEQVEQSIRESVDNVYDIVVHVEPKGIVHKKEIYGVGSQTLPGE
ncbi:MAG: cation diffusion facilitator family transporter [Rikenellaceae bacterium]|nr:cation diffusion facilitator family transporter [Rikenellaceae bacterium]